MKLGREEAGLRCGYLFFLGQRGFGAKRAVVSRTSACPAKNVAIRIVGVYFYRSQRRFSWR